MLFWRKREDPDEQEDQDPPIDFGLWSARLAWLTIALVAVAVVLRLSFATVLRIHGHGMTPSLRDGDAVLMLRGRWSIESGDVVIYEARAPVATAGDDPFDPELGPSPYPEDEALPESAGYPNAAVLDAEMLKARWSTIKARASTTDYEAVRPGEIQVGRVLAMPGDTVTFNVPGAALGLAINGESIIQKSRKIMHLHGDLEALDEVIWTDADGRPVRAAESAYEWLAERRYPVLASRAGSAWPGMALPDPHAPVQMVAEGYLVVADNRDAGACCDARRLGWISGAQIRGEAVSQVRVGAALRSAGALAWDLTWRFLSDLGEQVAGDLFGGESVRAGQRPPPEEEPQTEVRDARAPIGP